MNRLLCACFALFLVACSNDGGGGGIVPPPPGQPAFRWMNPVSQGNSLTDVWGTAPDNLFITGNQGIVLRSNGAGWRLTHTPVTGNLNAVWGADASHVFAVGQDGVILSFNGSSWTEEVSPTVNSLSDLWGFSATDVYAVGQHREVIHFDGASWDTMAVADGIENLSSVWGSSPGDIYATGLGTRLLHYNGSSWGQVETNATFALEAVWGTGPDDVFAVGGNGAAVRWDGGKWSNIDIGGTLFPLALWGTASNDVYAMGFAAGAASAGFHWDGFSWTPIAMHTLKGIAGVFGTGGRVVAVGQDGTIHEGSGTEFAASPGGMTADMQGVWVVPSTGEAYAVGDLGTILHFKDGTWTTMDSGTTENLRAVNGTASNDIVAVGENGVARHYNGTTWTDISYGLPVNLNAVWMDAYGDAFVAGDGGAALRLQASFWTPLPLGTVSSNLMGVWGSSSNDVYFVGASSAAFRWNGSGFKNITIDPGTTQLFYCVNGTGATDIYVGSQLPTPAGPAHGGGSIYHYDGNQWAPVFSDPISEVLFIWRAGPSLGYATGDSGTILRSTADDNGAWLRITDVPNLPYYVNAVWGSTAQNVFIVGDSGAIIRYSQ